MGGQGVKVVYDSVGKDIWEGLLVCLWCFGLMVSFGNVFGFVVFFVFVVLVVKLLYVMC